MEPSTAHRLEAVQVSKRLEMNVHFEPLTTVLVELPGAPGSEPRRIRTIAVDTLGSKLVVAIPFHNVLLPLLPGQSEADRVEVNGLSVSFAEVPLQSMSEIRRSEWRSSTIVEALRPWPRETAALLDAYLVVAGEITGHESRDQEPAAVTQPPASTTSCSAAASSNGAHGRPTRALQSDLSDLMARASGALHRGGGGDSEADENGVEETIGELPHPRVVAPKAEPARKFERSR